MFEKGSHQTAFTAFFDKIVGRLSLPNGPTAPSGGILLKACLSEVIMGAETSKSFGRSPVSRSIGRKPIAFVGMDMFSIDMLKT